MTRDEVRAAVERLVRQRVSAFHLDLVDFVAANFDALPPFTADNVARIPGGAWLAAWGMVDAIMARKRQTVAEVQDDAAAFYAALHERMTDQVIATLAPEQRTLVSISEALEQPQ